MCGNVGMAGKISPQAKNNIMKDMLLVNQLRGKHATGIIKVNEDCSEYDWAKNVGPPQDFFETTAFKEVMEGTASVLIGHGRHKTSGEHNSKSAHPFDLGENKGAGVHNGTLRNQYSLDTYVHNKVDSEVLYGHLSKNGPEETFNKVTGAWACVWWDQEKKTLNFIRNEERPLYLTWNKDQTLLFWASEKWMFGAIDRKEKLWDGGKRKQPFIELPINTLWSFSINTKAKGKEPVITMKGSKPIEPFTPVYTGYRGFKNNNNNNPQKEDTAKSWERKKGGNWQKKGGEVKDPFTLGPPNTEKGQEPSNSSTGKDDSTQTSQQNSGMETGKKNGMTSKSNIISLPQKGLAGFQPKISDVSSVLLKKQQENTILSILNQHKGNHVSFRVVAGESYITDNFTGKEISATAFEDKTQGICSFCEAFIGDITEVYSFIDDQNFICTDCCEEPDKIVLMKK